MIFPDDEWKSNKDVFSKQTDIPERKNNIREFKEILSFKTGRFEELSNVSRIRTLAGDISNHFLDLNPH